MRDERGYTLVELLGAMTIMIMITGILYGVFFGFNKNYTQMNDKSSMDQSANAILASMKQYHLMNDKYIIRYEDSEKAAYIGTVAADNLLGDSRYQVDMKIGFPYPQAFSGPVIIHSSQPIAVHLTLMNKTGQKFEIETIIKRY